MDQEKDKKKDKVGGQEKELKIKESCPVSRTSKPPCRHVSPIPLCILPAKPHPPLQTLSCLPTLCHPRTYHPYDHPPTLASTTPAFHTLCLPSDPTLHIVKEPDKVGWLDT